MKSRYKIKQDNKRNIIQKQDLKNLDDFIQKCLDNFKFVEPKKELYETTGIDKDLIISHKSTIPDLVIWNKTFNKNNCFIGANTSIQNEFPRYLFYIKIKKNKKMKNNNSTNNKKDDNNINNFNIDFFEDNKSKNNNIINEKKDSKNYINELNKDNLKNEQKNNFNLSEKNTTKNKNNQEKNKLSFNQYINTNSNNSNILNFTIYLIQLYMDKNGWIILTKDEHFSGPGTSMDLYQFLQEKIKEEINLNELIIIDINKQVKYLGNYFFVLLSNVLPNIIKKKQLELLKFEAIMNKHQNQKSIINNIYFNHIQNYNPYFSNSQNYNILNFNNINNNNINNSNLFSERNYNLNNNKSESESPSNEVNQINNYTINNINNINQYLFMNNKIPDDALNSKDNDNNNLNNIEIYTKDIQNKDKSEDNY